MTTVQVTNTRRPGDIERIRIANYMNLQSYEVHGKPGVQSLPESCQVLTKEFGIITIVAKKGNLVKVLLDLEVHLCIDMLLRHRRKLDMSPNNNYLFALPKTPDCEIRHMKAYTILRRFAVKCGAMKPQTLRATKLRKRLATECLKWNLNYAETSDLARYMGHHVDVHNKNYRQHMAERDIGIFARFFEVGTRCEVESTAPEVQADCDDVFQDEGTDSLSTSAVNINEHGMYL